MRVDESQWVRLQFLARVTHKECQYLLETDQRLFTGPMTIDLVQKIEMDPLLAERLDAFVSRFGRLQDNLGDKLLPQLLDAMAEPVGAVIENLDRAEKLGWLSSSDTWLEIRKLRNQMVHEYIEDLAILSSALQAGHAYVPVLIDTAKRLTAQINKLNP
ncbi:hypothetical protein B9Z38_01445 [Limnohabitans sp. MMS-10A-160]|uniref:hypothetical protein n=1 Tax=unclassified Limnohabitans TaxID=2626134 RepID=UPI000D3AA50A|nr:MULTISPECIES: hypothetical protein [unclassified Limnohabitans]PUE19636.1 hypothetical protein B9Z43_07320 [Limnohabitans sp. MMS-10A-192]PUE26997.1 hypothetical protein B9Z38_01445 [Limnohabitans sp. MMS-10A-160]